MTAWVRWVANASTGQELPSPADLGVPLLGVRGRAFFLGVTEALARGRAQGLSATARRSLRAAQRAADHLVPAPAGPTEELGFRPVAQVVLDGSAMNPAVLDVDGESYGLSFGLATLTQRLGIPVADTVYGTATIADDGILGRVRGLAVKIEGLASLTQGGPGVTLMVASEQAQEATALADPHRWIEVRGVSTLAAAAEVAFGSADFIGILLNAISGDERDLMVRRWFRDVTGRRAIWQWSTLRRFLSRALEVWQPDGSTRTALAIARDVAWRFEANACGQDVTIEGLATFLDTLTATERLVCEAHLVQQAIDTDAWPEAWVRRIADDYKGRDVRSLIGVQREVAGAVGRWWGTGEDPALGLTRALELAQMYVELEEYKELGRPLSEALRLAGALEDHRRWEEAEVLARQTNGVDLATRTWSCASAARGAWLLGRNEQARSWLHEIDIDEARAAGVGFELLAIVVRMEAHLGLREPAWLASAELELLVGDRDARIARAAYDLEREADTVTRTVAAEQLARLDPGVVARLERGWRSNASGSPWTGWLRRFYPY